MNVHNYQLQLKPSASSSANTETAYYYVLSKLNANTQLMQNLFLDICRNIDGGK